MTERWDETWHRLREWTSGQGPSERLAAQVLLAEGFTSLDPSHPLGGRDGGKDALCRRDGIPWAMAVYFPRGQQAFSVTKAKFLGDLFGAKDASASGIAFVTNQEVTLSEREELRKAAGAFKVELFHLERVTAIVDQPVMASVRMQFLSLEPTTPSSTSGSALTISARPAWTRSSKRRVIVSTGSTQSTRARGWISRAGNMSRSRNLIRRGPVSRSAMQVPAVVTWFSSKKRERS